MKSCATCENFEREDATCRVEPPRVLRRLNDNFPPQADAIGRWPVVRLTDWCAHHKAMPEAVAAVPGQPYLEK